MTTPASPPEFPAAARAQIDAQLRLRVTTPDLKGTDPVAPGPAATTIDKLLTSTKDDPKEPVTHSGNLSVDRATVGEFKKAETDLAKDREAVDVPSVVTDRAHPAPGQDLGTPGVSR